VERTICAHQQPTPDTQAQQLSMEKKDLELSSAPATGGVEVHNGWHRFGLYLSHAIRPSDGASLR
jgi:hypothetical protein